MVLRGFVHWHVVCISFIKSRAAAMYQKVDRTLANFERSSDFYESFKKNEISEEKTSSLILNFKKIIIFSNCKNIKNYRTL